MVICQLFRPKGRTGCHFSGLNDGYWLLVPIPSNQLQATYYWLPYFFFARITPMAQERVPDGKNQSAKDGRLIPAMFGWAGLAAEIQSLLVTGYWINVPALSLMALAILTVAVGEARDRAKSSKRGENSADTDTGSLGE